MHRYSATPKNKFVPRGKIKKGVKRPLSKAEKQGLRPQVIVPLKLRAKNASEKQVESLRYKIEAQKHLKAQSTN
jgi:hypothetical protein